MLQKLVCYGVVGCLSLGFSAAVHADLYTDADLLAYWNFDQAPTSGTTVVDQSTTTAADQLNLTMDADAGWIATGGVTGGCINFSSGGGLSASDSATAGEPIDRIDFNPTDDFTMAYWIKIPTVNGETAITGVTRVLQKVSGYKGWFMIQRDNDQAEYYLRENYDGTMYAVSDRSNDTLPLEEWVHVAWTFEGIDDWAGGDRALTSTLYVDGEVAGTRGSGVWQGDPPITANDGNFTVFNSGLAAGADDLVMDDIAIWGRALGVAEIRELAAVPEPSSLALILVGAIGAGVVARRKTRTR